MGVNHVVFDGDTIVDLRDLTVTPEKLLSGATACNAAGEKITGAMEAGGFTVTSDGTGNVTLSGSITVQSDDSGNVAIS